jgi:hypothetical protein
VAERLPGCRANPGPHWRNMAHADELRRNAELFRRAAGHRTEGDRKIDRTLIALAESLECEGEARGNRGGIPPGKDIRESLSASAVLLVVQIFHADDPASTTRRNPSNVGSFCRGRSRCSSAILH